MSVTGPSAMLFEAVQVYWPAFSAWRSHRCSTESVKWLLSLEKVVSVILLEAGEMSPPPCCHVMFGAGIPEAVHASDTL